MEAEPELSADAALLALAAASPTRGPLWLHLLVADRCNHSCQHCYQVQGLKGELAQEQIEHLLQSFRDGGGFVVSFSGGEATLRDDLTELLAFAHTLGLATVLYTNGFSMTRELATELAACHVWRVEISLYSDLAEEHDAVTRVPGSWQKTVQGIRFLRELGVNVTLKFTHTARSSATPERLTALASSLDAHLMVGELVSAGEGGRLEPTSARRSPTSSARGFVPLDNALHSKPCGIGSGQLDVRSDGRIQPCAQLQISMGQVELDGTGLARAAESEIAQFFRGVTWNDLHGCRDCELRDYCSRCFASAAAEAGDLLAPYRGACELAVARYREHAGRADSVVLAPEPSGEPRDPALGPYRVEPDGNLRPILDRRTPEDDLLAHQHTWLRPSRPELEISACSAQPARHDSSLVQLRRLNSEAALPASTTSLR